MFYYILLLICSEVDCAAMLSVLQLYNNSCISL